MGTVGPTVVGGWVVFGTLALAGRFDIWKIRFHLVVQRRDLGGKVWPSSIALVAPLARVALVALVPFEASRAAGRSRVALITFIALIALVSFTSEDSRLDQVLVGWGSSAWQYSARKFAAVNR